MEYTSFSEQQVSTNDQGAVIREPSLESSPIGDAEIYIENRYPKEGFALNTACDILAIILEQRGRVLYHPDTGKEPITVSRGGKLYIPQGEAYAFEGPVKLEYVSFPPWTPDQAKHIQ